MQFNAHGPFEVKTTPQAPDAESEPMVGRLLLDKQFHGDLEAVSKGQMLASLNASQDAGGYVAIERVVGTLNGQSGSFMLMHFGTMTRAGQDLTINVVPESGTDELAGIAGTMTITNLNGDHSYDFAYSLPD